MSRNSDMGTKVTGGRRYRSWPEALKREIVAASFAPGASVSVVARHYDVNANQVFSWRKRFGAVPSAADQPGLQLVPVMVAAEPQSDLVPAATGGDLIEIDVDGKYRLRVGSGVDARALLRVLTVLERR